MIQGLEGRSSILGDLETSFPAGLIAVRGHDARSLGAFMRMLHRLGWAGAGEQEASARAVLTGDDPEDDTVDLAVIRLGTDGEDDPTALLRVLAEACARLVGGARIESAASRLGIGGVRLDGRETAAEEAVSSRDGSELSRGLRGLEGELREVRADHAEVAGDLEVATMAWLRERQDAETHLQAYRDRARELKSRLTQLEGGGAASPCPTCGRVLHDEFGDVVSQLREEWESVVQDGSWWKRRREQLELKPMTLQELEGRSLRLQAATEECAERLERARVRVPDSSDEPREDAPQEHRTRAARSLPDGDALPETLARAMANVRERLRSESTGRVAELGSRVLTRITGSHLLGLVRGPSGSVTLEGVSGAIQDATAEESAALLLALRIGAALALLEEGYGSPGFLVIAEPFDKMWGEDRLRTIALLRTLLERIPQIILLTRGTVLDRSLELFDAVFDLRARDQVGGRDAGPAIRPLLSAVGAIRVG